MPTIKQETTPEQRALRKAARMRSSEEVILELEQAAPHVTAHLAADRNWLWYIGPSLKNDPGTREVMKDAGFIWAPDGHNLLTGEVGTWGHCCGHPVKFMRRGRPEKGGEKRETKTETAADPFAALMNLAI